MKGAKSTHFYLGPTAWLAKSMHFYMGPTAWLAKIMQFYLGSMAWLAEIIHFYLGATALLARWEQNRWKSKLNMANLQRRMRLGTVSIAATNRKATNSIKPSRLEQNFRETKRGTRCTRLSCSKGGDWARFQRWRR